MFYVDWTEFEAARRIREGLPVVPPTRPKVPPAPRQPDLADLGALIVFANRRLNAFLREVNRRANVLEASATSVAS